jgi:hypothetical protein
MLHRATARAALAVECRPFGAFGGIRVQHLLARRALLLRAASTLVAGGSPSGTLLAIPAVAEPLSGA